MTVAQTPDQNDHAGGDSTPTRDGLSLVWRLVVAAALVPVVVLVAVWTRSPEAVVAVVIGLLLVVYWVVTGKVRPPAG